jgi:hypothetical protein
MTRAFALGLRNAVAALFTISFAACDVPPDAGDDPEDEAPVAVIDPLLAADGAAMGLQNRESAPFPDRLVFSSLSGDTTGQKVHDHSVLRVSSTGTAALTLSALTVTGPFALSPKPTLPVTVAPGSHIDLTLAFTATALGKVQTGGLTIATNVPGAASVPVALAGSRTKPEGGNEPSFVQIIQLFGYKTAIVNSGQQLNQHGLVQAVGDEVLSSFWKPLDATKAVGVRQLAAYHTRGGTGPIAWYAKGSTTVHSIVASGGDNAQTVLPRKNGSTTSASSGSFTPGGTFGLKVAGEFSEPQRNNVAKDMQNGCPGPCGHHVRFWPAKDRAGNPIAGTFIVAMDSSSVNYDYQDDVFLISNATPE